MPQAASTLPGWKPARAPSLTSFCISVKLLRLMSRFLALLAVLALALISPLHAEDSHLPYGFAGLWATGGRGYPLYGSSADYLSIAASNDADKVFVVRYADSRKHDASISPDESVKEWGFLVGEVKRPAERMLFYAGVGLGSAQVTTRGAFLGWRRDAAGTPLEQEFATSRSNNFALMYDAQVLYAPVSFAAVGLSFFGDYNSGKPLSAVALTVHFGFLPMNAVPHRSTSDDD